MTAAPRTRSLAAVRWLPAAAGALVALALWKAIVVLGNYPLFILPPPESVFGRLVSATAAGLILPDVVTTLSEVLLGFGAGASLAIVVGALLARWRVAELVLSPYLVAAQVTPILALAPLITLWFGTGLASKVIICGLIVFFPVAVATMVGFRGVDRGLIEMARSFRADGGQVLRTVEIPSALPSIFGGLRVGVTLAVIGAIVAEWAGADRGLGVLINLARGSLFDIPLMFAALITVAGLGLALYLVVVIVERRVIGRRG